MEDDTNKLYRFDNHLNLQNAGNQWVGGSSFSVALETVDFHK
jgi:hypothetical protein